jgi:hypothetical protein
MKKNGIFDQNPKEIKINPSIVLEMVEKYQIPLNPVKNSGEFEQFNIETILKSLALNKHNDSTTTYYLLHKKWAMQQTLIGPPKQQRLSPLHRGRQTEEPDDKELVTLTPSNYE